MKKILIHNEFYKQIKDIEGISLFVRDICEYEDDDGEEYLFQTSHAIDKYGTHYFVNALEADYSMGITDESLYVVHKVDKDNQSAIFSASDFLKSSKLWSVSMYATPLYDKDERAFLEISNQNDFVIRFEDDLSHENRYGRRFSEEVPIDCLKENDAINIFSPEIELVFADDYLTDERAEVKLNYYPLEVENKVHYEKHRLDAVIDQEDYPSLSL